jgi:hypothetical protein
VSSEGGELGRRRKGAPLNREVELGTATELRGDPELSAHELNEALRNCGREEISASTSQG